MDGQIKEGFAFSLFFFFLLLMVQARMTPVVIAVYKCSLMHTWEGRYSSHFFCPAKIVFPKVSQA